MSAAGEPLGFWCWSGFHQGSVLSPLLFIIVLEALSREFRTGCPWELLYVDDLMISAESMEELLVKVQTWKTEMEKKGLRHVNMGKSVRSVMLHAAETWAMKVDTLNCLRSNDRAMIHWICNVRAKDKVNSHSLLIKLGIKDLDVVLHIRRMRWFGHVERSTGWIAEVCKLNVVAQKGSGRSQDKEIIG